MRLSGALKGEDAPSGRGVNRDAVTTIDSVFIITNQGAQSVGVWLADTSDAIAFEREGGVSFEEKANAVQLDPGDTVAVGVRIDTRQATDDALNTDITINADQRVEGVAPDQGSSSGGSGDSPTNGGGSSKTGNSDSSNDNSDNKKKDCDWTCLDDKAEDRFFTDDGKIDINGDGISVDKKVNDRINELRRGDIDGDGTTFLREDNVQIFGRALKGALYGGTGQAGGFRYKGSCNKWTCVSKETANSPAYLVGWVGSTLIVAGASVVTGGTAGVALGAVAASLDVRDGTQNLANGNSGLEAIDFLGPAGDGLKVVGKTAKLGKISKYAPDSSIKKIAKVKLAEATTDAPVKKLSSKGIPIDDIPTYHKKDINYQLVLELRSKGMDIPSGDIRYYVDEGISLERVKRLRKGGSDNEALSSNKIRSLFSGNSQESIETLVKEQGYSRKEVDDLMNKGGDVTGATELRSKGYSKAEVNHLVDKDADLKAASELQSQGLSKTNINNLVDRSANLKAASKLRSQEVSKTDVNYLVDEGTDLEKASELKKQETSEEHLRYYADNDIRFSSVSKVQNTGLSPKSSYVLIKTVKTNGNRIKDINNYDKLSRKNKLKVLNKELDTDTRISEAALEIVKAELNRQTWKNGRKESLVGHRTISQPTTPKIFKSAQIVG